MITEINNNIFDYGFMSREAKNGNLKPSINWAYGPWEGELEDIAKNISQTLFGTENTALIPDCLTIAVKSEKNTYKEYWWMKENFVEKTGTGSGTSGSGNAPVLLNFQVITTRTVFEVPVDANGACTAEVLEAATKTPIEIYYNGNRWDGKDSTIVLQSTPEDGYVAKMEQDTGHGYNLIYLTFAAGDKEPHKITDKTSLFFTFLIDGIYYAHISFTIRATLDQYIYSITNTPNVLYIDSQGLVNKVQMNVDKFNTNTGDIILNPNVTVNAEYLCMSNGTRYKIGNITQNNEITNSSTITIGDDEYTLGEVYKKYKDTFLRAGEPIYITIPDTNYQSMVMISRAADMTGGSIKKYDISLSDEYVQIPAAWFSKKEDGVLTNTEYTELIQSLTKTTPIYGSTVEDGKITTIECSSENYEYLYVIKSDGTPQKYSDWKETKDDITSYYFTHLLRDDTVLVNFSFTLDGEKNIKAFVSQVIAYSEVVAGTVYLMTTNKQSIGVDFDDKLTKNSYSVLFYAKEYGKELKDLPIRAFGKDKPTNDQDCYVLLLSSHDWLEWSADDGFLQGKEALWIFTIDENKFQSQDMEFCLWVNGAIVDYCNIGVYQKPKDGAEYILESTINSIPVNISGKYEGGDLISTITLKRTASGSTRSLATSSIEDHKMQENGEWSLYVRPINGGDNDGFFESGLSESDNSYKLNIKERFPILTNSDDNVGGNEKIFTWPGFTIVAVVHRNGENFEITKDILLVSPGKDGVDGDPGEPGTNGAQIRFLGDWSETKYYCYLSYIKPEANERKENGEWKYATDDVYEQTDGLLYVDVVSTSDGKYWLATQNSKGLTPATGSTYWVEAEHYGTLITDYMITLALEAKNITADSILVPFDAKDNNKGYRAGISNHDTADKGVVMWAGASEGETTGTNAKFKVYNDGSIECTNINSSINGFITSTNEVEVPLDKLEKIDSDNSDELILRLDFTKFGPNILLTDNPRLTDGYNPVRLQIDLPSYAYVTSINGEHTDVIDVFSNRGYDTTEKVKNYIKFVDKFKRTNVRIRTVGILKISDVSIRGCLSCMQNRQNGHKNVWAIGTVPRQIVLMSSLNIKGEIGNDWDYTNSINDWVTFGTDETNDYNILPTNGNADLFYTEYPLHDYNVIAPCVIEGQDELERNEASVVAFDMSFIPKLFTMQDFKSLNLGGSYFESKYNGVYWEPTDIYRMSAEEAKFLNWDPADGEIKNSTPSSSN